MCFWLQHDIKIDHVLVDDFGHEMCDQLANPHDRLRETAGISQVSWIVDKASDRLNLKYGLICKWKIPCHRMPLKLPLGNRGNAVLNHHFSEVFQPSGPKPLDSGWINGSTRIRTQKLMTVDPKLWRMDSAILCRNLSSFLWIFEISTQTNATIQGELVDQSPSSAFCV